MINGPAAIKVVFFLRKPLPIHKSVESIFDDVSRRLPLHVTVVKKVFSYYSTGIINRLLIMLQAYKNQGDVNHITGDVHFAAIFLQKQKTIITVHDCIMLATSTGIKHTLLKWFWFVLPFRRARYITVVSNATKTELLKYVQVDDGKVIIIPNAISTSFKPFPKPFNETKPVLLQVGITPNKNLDRLTEAIKDIDCELVIIGQLTNEQKKKLEISNIYYKNYWDLSEPALIEHYQNCDIVTFVSTYEGFGMPILEAQAVGRAVITSNILSMPEVAGKGACLVDPYDVAAIRNAVLKIIHNRNYREGLVLNGFENVKTFNQEKIADIYGDLYKKVAYQHL